MHLFNKIAQRTGQGVVAGAMVGGIVMKALPHQGDDDMNGLFALVLVIFAAAAGCSFGIIEAFVDKCTKTQLDLQKEEYYREYNSLT